MSNIMSIMVRNSRGQVSAIYRLPGFKMLVDCIGLSYLTYKGAVIGVNFIKGKYHASEDTDKRQKEENNDNARTPFVSVDFKQEQS